MRITKVIESKVWRHKGTGLTVSQFSLPWGMGASEDDKAEWELVSRGYTWIAANGTVGLGRKPVATRQEAEDVMRRVNGS